MRRFIGIVVALSMLQVASLDLRAECERHAPSQDSAMPGMNHAGHDMSTHRDPTKGKSTAPAPKCCMLAGTCVSPSFASIVVSDEVAVVDHTAAVTDIARGPAAPPRAPEPPPPRAQVVAKAA